MFGTKLSQTGGGSGSTSPLNTKGDIWGFSSVDARIPVGTNGQVLVADSTQTLGVKWANAGSGDMSTAVYDISNIAEQVVGLTATQTLTNKNLTSGTNTFPTFNQNTTGSAATLTTPRTIGGVSFDGSANITVASATGGFTVTGGDIVGESLKAGTTSAGVLIKNSNGVSVATFGVGSAGSTNIALVGNTIVTGNISATNLSGTNTGDQTTITGNAGTATALATARAIYGNNFDGTAALTQVIASTYGGTGNGFTKFTGATTTEKIYTLPNSSETLLYAGGALGTPSSGTLTNATGLPISGITGLGTGVGTFLGTPSSANLLAAITDETGTGALVFGTSPTITTPTIAKLANLISNGFVKTSGGDGTLSVDTSTYITGNQTITLSGDVTGSGATAITTSIANDAVTNAMLANMVQATIKGRASGAGTGDPVDLTATQATAILNEFTGDAGSGGLKGLVKAPSAGDSSKFLKGDGTWASISGGGDALTTNPLSQFAATTSSQLAGVISDETGSGSLVFATSPTLVTPVLGVASATSINKVAITAPATGSTLTIADGATLTVNGSGTITNGTHSGTNTGDQTITLTGDVTGSGTGSFAATIANSAVTYAKIQNVSATDRVLGRTTAGAGVIEEIATTGSGSVVRATSPTLVTPALGTPSSGTLTNATGLPLTGLVNDTTTALGVGSINLGHASDTTIARVSAGVISVEGVNVVTTSSTDTLTNKTLTTPKFADLGYIADANGNELIILDTVASAVNEVTFANAATGNDPNFTASGGDTNVGIKLTTKGTGKITTVGSVNHGDYNVYFTETDNGNSSTADTIDWTKSNHQKSTLTGNCTFTFTAPNGASHLTLKLVQDATGSRTVTFPAAVHWSGGTAPTLTTTANKVDVITFYYDGSTYFGAYSLNYTA